jgi:hypothetical protein
VPVGDPPGHMNVRPRREGRRRTFITSSWEVAEVSLHRSASYAMIRRRCGNEVRFRLRNSERKGPGVVQLFDLPFLHLPPGTQAAAWPRLGQTTFLQSMQMYSTTW